MKPVATLVLAVVLAGCGPATPADPASPASPAPGTTASEQPAPSGGAGDAEDTSSLPDPGKDLITDPAY